MLDDSGRLRPKPQTAHRSEVLRQPEPRSPTWRIYLGITGLLMLIVIALVGGIIWLNAKKMSDLMVADAERLMIETGGKVTERIRLLYDPVYAIVGLGSHVSDLTAPLKPENAPSGGYPGLFLMLRGLRIYPQIMSLYAGFENGDFFMITHLAGENAPKLRAALNAPPEAVFANEVVMAEPNGDRLVRWIFLTEDGSVISAQQPIAATFDPRQQHVWYRGREKWRGRRA